MTCDLERIFGALADRLPDLDPDKIDENDDDDDYDEIILNLENLPRPPSEMWTEKLSLRRGLHDYGSTPYENVAFRSSKRTLRQLGLLILSKVFHDKPEHVTLHIAKPAPDMGGGVRRLVLDYQRDEFETSNFVRKPDYFRYSPDKEEKHPWCGTVSPYEPREFPILYLAGPNWEMGRFGEGDLETAVGFGTDEGHVNFAKLLLNASMPWSERDEYELEGESGFRGVGPGSAEILIYLPGHMFYDDPVPWP